MCTSNVERHVCAFMYRVKHASIDTFAHTHRHTHTHGRTRMRTHTYRFTPHPSHLPFHAALVHVTLHTLSGENNDTPFLKSRNACTDTDADKERTHSRAYVQIQTPTHTWALLWRHTALSATTVHLIWHQSMQFLQCRFGLYRTHQVKGRMGQVSVFPIDCMRGHNYYVPSSTPPRQGPRCIVHEDIQRDAEEIIKEGWRSQVRTCPVTPYFSIHDLSTPNLDAILSVEPYVYAEWIYRHTYIHI